MLFAARYVSTLFAFTLAFALVKIMKMNCLCCKYLINNNHSITEGISAFLVVSYSQCTRATFQILQWPTLRTTPGNPEGIWRLNMYFSQQHLFYALPAIISHLHFSLFSNYLSSIDTSDIKTPPCLQIQRAPMCFEGCRYIEVFQTYASERYIPVLFQE